jgi:hypothetical protein
MFKEFWSEAITKKSWERLLTLEKDIDFVLIGGWAVFLYTKLHKSKDIDILVSLEELYKLKEKFSLNKNDRLKKYEIKEEGYDIDVYVPHYSKLALPINELIEEHAFLVNGIKTLSPEALVFLKQAAYEERKNSVKGEKDAIDMVCLLIYSGFNPKKYLALAAKHKKTNALTELITMVKNFQYTEYTGLKFQEYQKWKKNFLEKTNNNKKGFL